MKVYCYRQNDGKNQPEPAVVLTAQSYQKFVIECKRHCLDCITMLIQFTVNLTRLKVP